MNYKMVLSACDIKWWALAHRCCVVVTRSTRVDVERCGRRPPQAASLCETTRASAEALRLSKDGKRSSSLFKLLLGISDSGLQVLHLLTLLRTEEQVY